MQCYWSALSMAADSSTTHGTFCQVLTTAVWMEGFAQTKQVRDTSFAVITTVGFGHEQGWLIKYQRRCGDPFNHPA